MKFYCQSCGTPNEAYSKPNYCSNCSAPFGGMPIVNKSNPVKIVNSPGRTLASDEESEEIPRLEKLDYRIEGSSPRGASKIGFRTDANGFQTDADKAAAQQLARRNASRLAKGSDGKIQSIGIEPPDEDFKLKPIQKVKGAKFSKKKVLEQFSKDAGSDTIHKNVGGE